MSTRSLQLPSVVTEILRDPVSLDVISAERLADLGVDGYLRLRTGRLSAKNEAELSWFQGDYPRREGSNYADRLGHLAHPDIGDDAIVLDVGCGPRDLLAGMPGIHIFVDDIMDAYVTELGAEFNGVPICARTELLPFDSGSIDVVYAINMMDHVDDMVATAHELHRVLRPGGVIVVHSYFNSHPLLPSEPGVFDAHYFSQVLQPLFEVSDATTHAVGGPTIGDHYTMDVITCQLRRRADVGCVERDRTCYAAAGFLGPQSHIAGALEAIDQGRAGEALVHIDELSQSPFYEVQEMLLRARWSTAVGDFSGALGLIKDLASHPRVERNLYARFAILEVDRERIREAAIGPSGRVAELSDAITARDCRVDELTSAVRTRDARLAELESALRGRDDRVRELTSAVHGLDGRARELTSAIGGRDKRLSELDSAIVQRDGRIDHFRSLWKKEKSARSGERKALASREAQLEELEEELAVARRRWWRFLSRVRAS